MPDVVAPLPNESEWKTRSGFVLATIGSAVGIGSIWKFPYEVGANGGGAFVVVYLAGLALVVVPLMLAEFAIGRRGAGTATSIERAAITESVSPRGWRSVGVFGASTALLILSFYAVIGVGGSSRHRHAAPRAARRRRGRGEQVRRTARLPCSDGRAPGRLPRRGRFRRDWRRPTRNRDGHEDIDASARGIARGARASIR